MKKNNIKLKSAILLILLTFAFGNTPMKAQKFTSDLETFKQYQYPEWFRDAKFGIWSHWGPQAVPRQGDWYARKMYESDVLDWRTKEPTGKPSREYEYHVEHYGHPSKFGYKDIIGLWKAERWNPEELMKLYKKNWGQNIL